MKKRLIVSVLFFLISILVCDLSEAQLINYGRRNRFLRQTNLEMTEEDAIPQWAKDLVAPQNAEERRYDTNRDGLLQTAEVKVYLRDIIQRVEDRSYVNVTTDILREYDRNNDGVINSYELDLMREHVK